MQLLSRSLEKHPLAISVSLWNTFPSLIIAAHTILPHYVIPSASKNGNFCLFSPPFSASLCVSKCPSTPPPFSHQTVVPHTECWYLFCAVFQQWEAEVDLCFGSSAGRTGPPGMPWWGCSAATAVVVGWLAGVTGTVRWDTPEGFQGRILGVL